MIRRFLLLALVFAPGIEGKKHKHVKRQLSSTFLDTTWYCEFPGVYAAGVMGTSMFEAISACPGRRSEMNRRCYEAVMCFNRGGTSSDMCRENFCSGLNFVSYSDNQNCKAITSIMCERIKGRGTGPLAVGNVEYSRPGYYPPRREEYDSSERSRHHHHHHHHHREEEEDRYEGKRYPYDRERSSYNNGYTNFRGRFRPDAAGVISSTSALLSAIFAFALAHL